MGTGRDSGIWDTPGLGNLGIRDTQRLGNLGRGRGGTREFGTRGDIGILGIGDREGLGNLGIWGHAGTSECGDTEGHTDTATAPKNETLKRGGGDPQNVPKKRPKIPKMSPKPERSPKLFPKKGLGRTGS